jgi:hypothetical protein
MRHSRFLGAVVALALVVAVSQTAEAAGRRRGGRRGAPNQAPSGNVRSDESVSAVIDRTPSGGTAVLPAGIYRTSIVIDRPMTIVGSTQGTVLDATGRGRPVIEVLAGVQGVVLEDLHLASSGVDGLLAGGGNDGLTLRRVTISGSAALGARIQASAGVVLDRCSFQGNAGGGLDADGAGLQGSRLSFRANGGVAATLRGKGARLGDSAFDGAAVGIAFEGLEQTASRNSFRSVGLAARLGAASDTCTFERNDVRSAAAGVVAEPGSIYGAILANRFDRTTGDVVRLSGTWHAVRGNRMAGAAGAGVVADGASFQVEDNTIASTAGLGVSVSGPGNMVNGNVLTDTRGGAIDVAGDGCIVALNSINLSGGAAVVVAGLMNRLVGNRVLDARGDAIVLSGDLNTLQENVCERAAGNGIHVVAGNANRLERNTVRLCGGAGLLDEGVGTVLFMNAID